MSLPASAPHNRPQRSCPAVGCVQTGTSSYEISCTSASTYSNTTFTTTDCSGPSTTTQGATEPCTLAAGGVLHESGVCMAGAYTSPVTGATATSYGGANSCTPSSTIVSEATFEIGCVDRR